MHMWPTLERTGGGFSNHLCIHLVRLTKRTMSIKTIQGSQLLLFMSLQGLVFAARFQPVYTYFKKTK